MQGIPLPAADTLWADHPRSEDLRSIYSFILEAEKAALPKHEESTVSTEKTSLHALNIVCARLVGYLILEPLNDVAQSYVLDEIKSYNQLHGGSECALNDSIYELGLFYLNYFVRPFKRYYLRRTPPRSGRETPNFSFDTKQEYAKEFPRSPPTNPAETKCAALVRDDYRCVVCQKYDIESILLIRKLEQEVAAANIGAGFTRCCHIISGLDSSSTEPSDYKESLWTVLANFGETSLRQELSGVNVHRLDNILTLEAMAQVAFDSLNVWFNKADPSDPNDHRYYIRTSFNPRVFALTGFPIEVRFVNHAPGPQKYPLPNPRYRYLHAACANVAHVSGAAEYLEKVVRDIEEGHELAEDGSSMDLLTHALLGLTPVGKYDS